jgi:hypothetical protein
MDLKSNLEEKEAVAVHQESLTKSPQWKLLKHRRTDLWARNSPWNTATHEKGGPRTILYEEPLKAEHPKTDIVQNRTATTA